MPEELKNKLKNFNNFSWAILVFGVLSFTAGLYQLFFTQIQFGTNLRYLQPDVVGPVKLILGFLCIIATLFRFRNRKKWVKDLIEQEKEDRRWQRRYWQSKKKN
ncbi:hypothetical protein [uncultured Croceitalea sp.]|uniref:hypothetical protein n=1 Tax=uncultured Croceitalea sp. TaxID=1798908 RepID=UPI003305E35E